MFFFLYHGGIDVFVHCVFMGLLFVEKYVIGH